ncbi:MAG: tripartite tricarboxylate transporter TctB family protein [Candidatus Rokubacteria bacterium]|nr:tripartite tricarboxylate transporter TctB family protein [Candidatus Rokubacteria bacterium]
MKLDGGRVTGAAAALVGLLAFALSMRLGEDTLTGGPGTRFLPASLGLIVAVLGAAIALQPGPGRAREAPAGAGARLRVAGTLGGLVLYALLFERLGFLVSTATFVVALLIFYGERRWPVVLTVAVGAAGATYAVFAWWLRVPLPPGILGP